jgi:hypothetical protein
MFFMGQVRVGAVRRNEVRVADIALGQKAWPERAQQVSNSYHNQFELPVLFYVLVILAMATRKADLLFVALAWIFVLLRFVHAFVHCTSNSIRPRLAIFSIGAIVLLVMWAIFAVRVLVGP